MAASQNAIGGMGSAGAPQGGGSDVIPLSAPSDRPDEPGQSGASMGPGLSPQSLGLQDPNAQLSQEDMQRISAMMPMLEYMSNLPGAMPSTRQLVRRLKSAL